MCEEWDSSVESLDVIWPDWLTHFYLQAWVHHKTGGQGLQAEHFNRINFFVIHRKLWLCSVLTTRKIHLTSKTYLVGHTLAVPAEKLDPKTHEWNISEAEGAQCCKKKKIISKILALLSVEVLNTTDILNHKLLFQHLLSGRLGGQCTHKFL